MKKIKQEKGITLIALVITIIVLLILAGVAISMLSGEIGILTRAAEAKKQVEEESTEEQIKLAIMSALTTGKGEMDIETLKSELKKITGEDIEIESLPAIVTINGREYTITKDGTAREANDIEKIKKVGTAVSDNITLIDVNGHSITIPKNFNISNESPTEIIKGMIIEDSEDNQYVWIPVFTKEQYSWGVDYSSVEAQTEDTEEYYTAIQTALKSYTATYTVSSCADVWYGDENYGKYGYYEESDTAKENLIYYTNGNMIEEEYNTLYNNMLKSVYKNGGFYIGRYEMGIEVVNSIQEAQKISRTFASREYVANGDNSVNEEPTIDGMAAPVSKENAVGYNYITQSQAQMLAEKIGEKTDYSNVTSSMMFGIQWNSVCVFIENFDTNNTALTKSDWLKDNAYGKLWGNYANSSFKLDQGFYTTTYTNSIVTWNQDYATTKGTSTNWLCTTGASKQNSSLNIYDFGGNLAEWTLEKYNGSRSIPCVNRGYYFFGKNSAYVMDFYETRCIVEYVTGRVSFYVK